MAILGSYLIIAQIYSILCLSLVVPFRSLDFLQMCYFFSSLMSFNCFSSNLGSSISNFNSNFLTFCQSGDIVCTLGFQLSFAAVIVGIMLLILIIVAFQKCSQPHIRYQPFYTFLKGLFKWIYLPIVVYSTQSTIIIYIGTTNTTQLVISEIILAIALVFPIFQLIFYSCIDENKKFGWRKWYQFFTYLRMFTVGVILGFSLGYNNMFYCHFILIPLVIYDLIILWKEQFKHLILEKFIFVLGQVIFLQIFLLFKYHSQYIQQYDLDFISLGVIIFIDLSLYVFKGIKIVFYGSSEEVKQIVVSPQMGNAPQNYSFDIPINKMIQTYQHDSRQQLQVQKR